MIEGDVTMPIKMQQERGEMTQQGNEEKKLKEIRKASSVETETIQEDGKRKRESMRRTK